MIGKDVKPMIGYDELKQFILFAQTGTLAKVAEEFHISQPSITRAMQKIEAEFGVPLFNRAKNRIELTSAGMLAAEEAARVTRQTEEMLRRVRAFDRANHTISLGSCAAVPISELFRKINAAFPEATLSSELKNLPELTKGLDDDTYQLIILPYKPEQPELVSVKAGEEHLLFCLPVDHRFANRDSLTMADMNGENMLLFQNIGFWYDIVREKMPDSRFLVQSERYSLEELILNSVLPCFSTNLTLADSSGRENRVHVPITDPEVNVEYYLVCKKENRQKFAALFPSNR